MLDTLLLVLVLLWVIAVTVPILRQQMLRMARWRLIARIQRQRGTRVITLIHRQERLSLLGIPILRYIDIDDSEKILRAIRLMPADAPIDLIVHTPGGLVLPAQQIAYALKGRQAPVTVIIPHFAMSGGTLIALAADEVLVDPNGVLGPVDPQIQERFQAYPAPSVLAVLSQKDRGQIDDSTLILADVAAKAVTQMADFVRYLLADRLGVERAGAIARALTEGRWTHDFPLMVPALRQLGLPVRTELPEDVYRLMDLYAQQTSRRPSVEHLFAPDARDRSVR